MAFAVLKKSMFANAVAAFHFGKSLEQWFVKSHKEEQSKQTTAQHIFVSILTLGSCQSSIREGRIGLFSSNPAQLTQTVQLHPRWQAL